MIVYIIEKKKNYTIREKVETSIKEVGILLKWEGKGYNEIGINIENKKVVVKIDKKYFRPTEVEELLGDYSKAKKELKWEPQIKFEELVKEMVISEIKNLEKNSR